MRVLLIALLVPLAIVACNESGGKTEPSQAAKRPDRFDSERAWRILKYQVNLGERPAGSRASRKLAAYIRKRLPNSSYQRVPGGLRNVIGRVPGREKGRIVLVGAHYDTKDIRGFVGANDGASGTAVALRLAREIKPRTIDPTLLFVFFDGEESPRGAADHEFEEKGLRGSKVAARRYASRVDSMVLLDFVGDRDLSIPREAYSDETLWADAAGCRLARRRGGHVPRGDERRDPGRPHPVRPARSPRDRPDRFRLPLLASPVRRPVGGLRAQPRPRRRDHAGTAP